MNIVDYVMDQFVIAAVIVAVVLLFSKRGSKRRRNGDDQDLSGHLSSRFNPYEDDYRRKYRRNDRKR